MRNINKNLFNYINNYTVRKEKTMNKSQLISDYPDQLSFSMNITNVPFPDPPDYLSDHNPHIWVDSPISPVMIDDEFWVIYKNGDDNRVVRWKGTNFEDTVRQPDSTAQFPVERPYILGGMWYDKEEKKLYAPLHCEIYANAARGEMGERQIHLATSTDKGVTWEYIGPIFTRDDTGKPFGKSYEYSGTYWDEGTGDFLIYVDEPNGYIYLYAANYRYAKKELNKPKHMGFLRHHVARCSIKDKMMPGKWHKFYNGGWDEPGLGGKGSYVNAYYVTYSKHLGKYIGLNYGSSIAVCTDLAKQDWTPGFYIRGDYWGCHGMWAIHALDIDLKNLYSFDRSLYIYVYWEANGRQPPTRKYEVEFSAEVPSIDEIVGETVYAPEGWMGDPIATMDPNPFYPIEPIIESSDPIEARRTRRVLCTNNGMVYTGNWNCMDERYTIRFDKTIMVSSAAGSSVEYKFKGADIYWRAVKGPDCGHADVYIDGVFQKKVDLYANRSTADQIAYCRFGLDAGVEHSIRIVVCDEKCKRSQDTFVRHLLFEYSADSYRASDNFSSIAGKNGWYYQVRNGNIVNDMIFNECHWLGDKCEMGHYHAEISYYTMAPASSDIIRKWIVQHDGAVRIEASLYLENPSEGGSAEAMILLGDNAIWPIQLVSGSNKPAHDFIVDVKEGDSICFVLRRTGEEPCSRVVWDPVITYI